MVAAACGVSSAPRPRVLGGSPRSFWSFGQARRFSMGASPPRKASRRRHPVAGSPGRPPFLRRACAEKRPCPPLPCRRSRACTESSSAERRGSSPPAGARRPRAPPPPPGRRLEPPGGGRAAGRSPHAAKAWAGTRGGSGGQGRRGERRGGGGGVGQGGGRRPEGEDGGYDYGCRG